LTTAVSPLQFLPFRVQLFDVLASTNDHLKQAVTADESLPEGTVIQALNQTSGRGQFDRSWVSEPGQNITLSVLLKPANLLANEAFMLSKAVALALCQTVSHFLKTPVSIKWPNDIFAGNRKIAGVLIENSIQGDWVKYSIIGIGLNLNQEAFNTDNNPTSLSLETGEKYAVNDVVEVLLDNLDKSYASLRLRNYKKLNASYFQKLYRVHENQTFLIHDEPRVCMINEVGVDGAIVLETETQKGTYLYGEARWKL
jgi:BirA family biotin operon repressor/biotin-[acetyl-CoA-carboxylase] ligase